MIESLEHIADILESPESARLPSATLAKAWDMFSDRKIELSERRASPKQRKFQQCFMGRIDENGRKCSKYIALGANRSGKSFAAGWMCFCKFIRDVAKNGALFWCIGLTLDRSRGGQQKELWEALPRWMFGDQRWDEKAGFSAAGHAKVVLKLRGGGKCMVEFRSCDQDPSTFEQAKLDGVWIDESCPEEIYNRLIPRVIDRDGFILYSDIREQWWQEERLVNAAPDAGVYFQQFVMTDNQHNLPIGAIEQARASMTLDQVKQRILGESVVMEGVVYKEYRDDYDGNLIRPFPIPEHWPKWRLIDYGGSAPTACPWIAMSDNERAYVYREYYQSGLNVAKNAQSIITMSGDEEYRETFMDPHAVDSVPAYYSASKTISQQYDEAGIKSRGWPFTNVMGEHAMVQRVKFRLERKTLMVFDTCINTRREMRSWKYKCDKEGRPIAADAFEKGNNHLLDCIRSFFGTNPCFAQQTMQVLR